MDVVVVGGGITGLTAAALLIEAGSTVAVIEADRIGGGTTGHTTGKVTSQHGLIYHRLIERCGEQRARQYADANQRGIETVARLADAPGVECGFQRAPAYVYTRSLAGAAVDSIEAEHRAATQLGLPSTLTAETDLPFEIGAAVRFDGQALIHPQRYVDALATRVAGAGGHVYEHSRVVTIEENGNEVTVGVRTEDGDAEIRSSAAVVATLLPIFDRGGYFARTHPLRSYAVAARLASGSPTSMHISIDRHTLSTRPWSEDGSRGVIVVGEGHRTGDPAAGPARWGELERWTRQHFDVDAFDYRWSAQDFESADRVPFVGRSPRTRNIYLATGFNKWGLTGGTAAAEIITALIHGDRPAGGEVFDSTRLGPDLRTVATLLTDNARVALHYVGDRLTRLRAPDVESLEDGSAGLVEFDGRTVAAYRDTTGTVHAVAPTCTHMGCTLRWNDAETTWDCPCHGSRFSIEGKVLVGPAVTDLDPVEDHGKVGDT